MKNFGQATHFAVMLLLLVSGCAAPNVIPATPASTEPSTHIPATQTPTQEPPPAPTAEPGPTSVPEDLFFDDFSYGSLEEMSANRWIIRS